MSFLLSFEQMHEGPSLPRAVPGEELSWAGDGGVGSNVSSAIPAAGNLGPSHYTPCSQS